jgi:putative Mn2+ efflux pump MntP
MFFDRDRVLSQAHYTQAYTMLGSILWANIFSWLAWSVWHEHRKAAVAFGLIGWPGILAIFAWVQWHENKSRDLSWNRDGASRQDLGTLGLILLTTLQAIQTCGQLALVSAPIFCAAILVGRTGFLLALLAYLVGGPLWFEIHREFLGSKFKRQWR